MPAPRARLAKTTRPVCAAVYPRPRLFKRLDEARRHPGIWLTGPPGAGKTTVIASYLDKRKINALWYQLDDTDTDIASFFFHLDAAAPERPQRGSPKLPRFTPEHSAKLSAFARRYFLALYQNLGKGFVLVFDGFHQLAAQSPLQEIISVALAEMPESGAMVLISRTDPPAAMARLRANRQLDVIGWRELKLTEQETKAITAQRGRALTRVQLQKIYAKTQGWAAGLILLLEQASEVDWSAPADLSTPQPVFDYLAGEIFDTTDPATQTVLLATASLPQTTPAMAHALSGVTDAGARLDDLYRNNYFVARKQADPQPVYEYHPMLREFLAARAAATLSREERQALQRAAAKLLQDEGLVAEAVALARSNADWERIADIVRRHARVMLDSGRSEMLAQWVDSMPKSFQEQNPWSLYWLGVARTQTSPREGRRSHERAFELFAAQQEPDVRGLLLACSGAMDAILYELDDFSLLDRWIDVMDRLLCEHRHRVSGPLEARILCSLFMSMVLRQPEHPQIEYWAEQAHRSSISQDDFGVRLSAEPRIALGVMYGGNFPRAWTIIEALRALVHDREVAPAALTMLRLVEATYYMLTAQPDACYEAVQAGLALEQAEGVNIMSRQLLNYGTGGALAAGDVDSAEVFLNQFEALPGVPARFDLCLHHLFAAWLAMRRHDRVRAYQQQKLALRMAIEVGCPVFEVLCRLAAAQVHYEGREPRETWLHLQQVYDRARHIHNNLLQYTGLLCYAYVALDSGRRPRSGMRSLRQALALGKPRNYVSFPLWCPEMLAQLCAKALEADIEIDFVMRFIAERRLELDARSSALLDWPWPVKIYTLGRFSVERSGRAIEFVGKAQRRPLDLLKVVVAYGGRNVAEERVVEALWPRIDGDSAHQSFTTTLHRLRKLLGVDRAILLSDGKLSLDARLIWVDTWACEQLLSSIGQMLRPELRASFNANRALLLSGRLCDAYAGPFLASESEAGWATPLRDRLRQRFVRTVVDLAQHWQASGATEQAINLLERAIEIDHVSESAYRSLMQCYARLGRYADAADTYNRCRHMLSAMLKVNPSPETTALYARISQSA